MYVEGLAERSHVVITLNVAAKVGKLRRDMELAIFRLVQECLTNIHRHSGSKTALIRIGCDGERAARECRITEKAYRANACRKFGPTAPGLESGEFESVYVNSTKK